MQYAQDGDSAAGDFIHQNVIRMHHRLSGVLHASMAEAGKVAKGGQVARLPSIPADAGAGMFALERLHDQPDGRQFSDTMKSVTREYYGTAGEAFLDKLTIPATLKETTDSTLGYGAKAEGRFIAFCALSDTTALAKARGLRGLLQAP